MRRLPTDVAIAGAVLLLAGGAKIPTLGQPLLEAHLFRQTQTAYTALLFHEQGIDLMRPQVPVFGPPWVLPFEFPLFQAAGALLMDAGVGPDIAMRSLGLLTFLLTGALLFGLVRRVAGRSAALIALVAFLFSPFGLLWGRTSLMEYLATAAAIGYLWAGIEWLETGHRGTYAGSLLAGIVALLTKATTGGFYLIPLLLYRGRQPRTRVHWIALAFLVVAPVIVGVTWTAYADQVKLAQASTAPLASSGAALREYYFGLISDRFALAHWSLIATTVLFTMTGLLLPLWALMAAAGLQGTRERRFLAGLLVACFLLPVLVLMPLYFVHDYYLIAVSPVVASMVGLGGSWLWTHRRSRATRALAVCAGTAWTVGLALTAGYWTVSYDGVVDRERTLQAAGYVRARTGPDDWVVLRGRDWDPAVFYYARRRGFMVRPSADAQDVITRLEQDERYTLFVDCPYSEPCRPMAAGD